MRHADCSQRQPDAAIRVGALPAVRFAGDHMEWISTRVVLYVLKLYVFKKLFLRHPMKKPYYRPVFFAGCEGHGQRYII